MNHHQPLIANPPSTIAPSPGPPPEQPARIPDAIPANNRIFVDNKMYEVHFVNGDIPVIEREGCYSTRFLLLFNKPVNIRGLVWFGDTFTGEFFFFKTCITISGLPYKIYFAGSPRDVVVDGVAHRLGFGEKKVVTIDGQNHIIRFGAPSKELYMGQFAFR